MGYLFSILTAFAWGAGAVVIRKAVAEGASPLGGAVVSLLFGGIILGLMSLGQYDRHLRHQGRALTLFLISGLASGLGVVAYFFALQLAPVVVVSPVSNVTPLLTIVIVQIFLRRLERATLRVWLGGLLVVTGVALVSMAQYFQ